MRVMHEFHSHGRLVKGSNSSFIVLIPKKDGACDLNHFRPISLIGSLYKVITKVLAKRLKMVMSNLISDSQSAFVSGRYILDGVVVLNELVEEAKLARIERMVFKVDFAKAYDSVDWDFLLDMLRAMKFPEKWILWISGCISSASANVLLNGAPSGEFALKRGLHQGDPLSPFLYLIVAEALNVLMNRAVQAGLIKPVVVGRDKVKVSHIQYADDTVFIVEGSIENALAIKWLLKNF